MEKIDKDTIVYVDECGCEEYFQRDYARSFRGQKIHFSKKGRKFTRTNILAARIGKKIIAPIIYKQRTTCILFEIWFVTVLLPHLEKGMTIVMDNASFHRKNALKQLLIDCKREDLTLIFLPPYSPDYNPIEKSWANLKKFLRNTRLIFSSLFFTIRYYFNSA